MHHPTDRIAHTAATTSRAALAGTRNMLSGRHSSPSNAWNSAKEINLQTHSEKRHFGLGMMEGNVLFNDALNMFYLRLYGVRHMVKDRSD